MTIHIVDKRQISAVMRQSIIVDRPNSRCNSSYCIGDNTVVISSTGRSRQRSGRSVSQKEIFGSGSHNQADGLTTVYRTREEGRNTRKERK